MEVELIINSQPLCDNSTDNDWEEPLTPNHLLFGRKLPHSNEYIESNGSTKSLSKRVNYIEKVIQHFWNRWRREYVVYLRNFQVTKKRNKCITPSVNDIVII